MSVIIRLQNLPWSANALDIRQYFHGLSIPEGGVHIVGGELGDAFIAFSTDEDARQAFIRNNGTIKEVQIKLMLSSRTEMQKVIEAARKQSLAAFMQTPTVVQHLPAAVPIIPSAIPEIKKEDKDDLGSRNEKRDRRRSRSKSRERKDRSRDRDRRDRHNRRGRSRSRSRDRRDRRRRERSRSRDRTRSKERERRDRSRERRRSYERGSSKESSTKQVGVWESPTTIKSPPTQPNLSSFTQNLAPLSSLLSNGFQTNNRSNWQLNSPNTHQTNDNNLNKPTYQNTQQTNRFNLGHRQNFNQNNQQQFSENSNNRFNNRPIVNNDNSYNNNLQQPHEQQQQIEFRNCCVRLRPYYGGYGEIRRFFQGIFIHNTGIKFVNDENGKRTGIVFVRFAYPEGKEQALERNGNLLKNQVAEVIHLDDEEFENAVDRYQPDFQDQDSMDSNYRNKNTKFNSRQLGNFTCLIVEDLPNFAKEQDVLKMFSDYSLLSIHVINRPRKSPVAYIKFSSVDEAKKAYDDKSKHIIDTKMVLVKPCRDDVFEQINREQNELMDNSNDDLDKSNFIEADSNCVLLSGLPIKTNDRDITDIFSDVGIIPDKIHLITGSLGFNGEAFCEFCSLEDAQIALEKDGMPLGTSIITVKCVPKNEMEAILGIRSQQTQMLQKNINPRPYFQPQPRNNFMGVPPRAPLNFMGMRPPPPIRRFLPPPHLSQNPDMMGPPGCTVLMENVPYKAGLDEILEFFNDYEILADNILRKFNPNGKPSGETKVIFGNADDAYQAVEQKNRQKIRDRTIYLTLC